MQATNRSSGEADSLDAMTGAIAGAYHGAAAIPARWLDPLEEGPKGRSHIERLADQLERTIETRSLGPA